jgi:2-oxoglutarate dehydrogenase E2 component (dihydrolipoamide succinyltransferase)
MALEVKMPQMGESVAEGTILKWLVKEGDAVEKDQPLFEISTDKVDAEIPSPAAGVLARILAPEGTTVEVGAVVAELAGAGEEKPAPRAARAPGAKAAVAPPPREAAPKPAAREAAKPAPTARPTAAAEPAESASGAPVVMPQMGESIAEGTILKWLVKVGDRVEKDAPLFEISTDKVDAEIPSPESGILTEILVGEGETALVGRTVARIGGAAGAAPEASMPKAASPSSTPPAGDLRSSPIARRIAREHGVDLAAVQGTGREGRVSKKDVLSYVEGGGARRGGAPAEMPAPPTPPSEPSRIVFPPGEETVVRPMSIMRRKIAEHMVASKQTSPHVLTVFEIDVTRAERVRAARKDEFEARHGARLTLTTVAIHSIIPAILRFPVLNASVSGDSIVYHRGINIGVAVALEDGLIVPVIKGAERLGIGDIARALQDLSGRARAKKLVPDEVQGATFTITNPGPYGALFGSPIINQPNVAILGMGFAKKRPVVIDEAIAVRDIAYFALSFDHRAIDGAVADQFMAYFKERIEAFSEEVLV